MRRLRPPRHLPAAAILCVILVLHAAPARAETCGRVVVVTVDGTRLADWRSRDLFAFGSLMRRGALGLASTRTATIEGRVGRMRREAYRAFGSGRVGARSSAELLASSLTRAGVSTVIMASGIEGSSSLSRTAIATPERMDGSFPGGRRTDYDAARAVAGPALGGSRVLIVDTGDTARVENALGNDPQRRTPWMRLSMARADDFIAWLSGKLTDDDVLIVASLTPPVERQRARRYLSAVAMTGAGIRPGVLTTPTTDRDGLVTIADLAPTILRCAGVATPKSMTGRPVRVVRDDNALARIASFEDELIRASILRQPLMRGTIWIASGLTLLSLFTVLAGRGLGGRPRGLPKTWRAFLETGLVGVAALPLVLLFEPLLRTGSLTVATPAVAGAAIGLAFLLRAATGSRGAIAVLSGATALVVIGDLTAGGPLSDGSPLSYLVAEGARFHGIGNEAMGVLIGAALIGFASALDRGITSARRYLTIGGLVVIVVVMGAPQLGAKFGSIPAAVPAFALLGLFAFRVRLTLRSAIAVAMLTVLIAGLAIVVDSLRNPDVQSHLGRAISGGGSEIIGRKAGAAGRLLAFSYWTVGIGLCGGSVLALVWWRSTLVSRALWGEPALRRALICCVIAAGAAVATNDAGVTAAAWLAVLAASAFFTRLLVSRDP